MEHAEFRDFNNVREFFNSVDDVPTYTIFDVENNYCLVVIVKYKFKKMLVHMVITHREYDDWNKLHRKCKG